MKNIKQLTLFSLFWVLYSAQIAGADIGQADATRFSSRVAVSPYAQAVPNDSYTFIGVSHPSLDSALTQIGVVLEAVGMATSAGTQSSRSAVFTVDAGQTHRVFIVNASNSTINDQNSSFTDSRTHLITTSNSAQFGSIKLTTVSERPSLAPGSRNVTVNSVNKFDNLAQLSIWGIVYIESSGTGFAMEFIGDMQDSTLGGNLPNGVGSDSADVGNSTNFARPARGIN